jgi:hypothetical protein
LSGLLYNNFDTIRHSDARRDGSFGATLIERVVAFLPIVGAGVANLLDLYGDVLKQIRQRFGVADQQLIDLVSSSRRLIRHWHIRIIYRHQSIMAVEENVTNKSLAKDFILLYRGGVSHKNPSLEQMQ